MTALLEIEDLAKSYGAVIALDGVSLTAGIGEIIGLLGPNGAGKTTLVSIICGLRRPDRGSVMVRGIDAVANPVRARRHIGLAPQDLGIYPIDTVRQNLALFGQLAGLRGPAMVDEIEHVAKALRLEEIMDRRAGELSGGQKRRLHTAIALLNRPPLVLLDEATVGADVETRSAVIGVVRGLAEAGTTVIYSTHYLQEIEAMDARVVIIDLGRIIAEGSVAQLLANSAGGVVELGFDGPPPGMRGRWDLTIDGAVMRVEVENPGRAIRDIFEALGPGTARLQRVEFINPSLETVFMSLTGRRYDPEEPNVLAS